MTTSPTAVANPKSRSSSGRPASGRPEGDSVSGVPFYWVDLGRKAGKPLLSTLRNHGGRRLVTAGAVRESYRTGERRAIWVAHRASDLATLSSEQPQPGTERRLLLLDHVELPAMHLLQALFRSVVPGRSGSGFLPAEELVEVLASPNRRDLFVGGVVDAGARVIVLYRGDMVPLIVPFDRFKPAGDGIKPDPGDFEVIDHGQTVRLGKYEAATSAILHELDREYRARARKNLMESDESPGSSIRRLRLQRRLARTDFPGVTGKTIARIERNEVRPQKKTTEIIARTLGVSVKELGSW